MHKATTLLCRCKAATHWSCAWIQAVQSESSLASIHRTFGGSVQPSGSHAAGYLARIPYMHLVHPALFGARRWWCTKYCIYGAARQRVRIKAQRIGGGHRWGSGRWANIGVDRVLSLSHIGNIYIWDSPQAMHNILPPIICKLLVATHFNLPKGFFAWRQFKAVDEIVNHMCMKWGFGLKGAILF